MGLITKPPSWGHCTDNLAATPTFTLGTAVTANANDADGSSVSLLANLSHDVEYLVVGFSNFSVSTGNGSTLLDILVDPAGGSSWASAPIINDLLVGESSTTNRTTQAFNWYHFPIWLKSGHSIGARARTAHTANLTGQVVVYAYGGNAHPASWWCGQHVTTIGVDDTISQGTNHTPGASGTFSAWANLGSTLPAPCGALQFGVHSTNTDTTQSNQDYHFEFGVGSTRIGPKIYRGTTTTEASWGTPTGVIFCSLPSGEQLRVRATAGAAGVEAIDVAAYAVH